MLTLDDVNAILKDYITEAGKDGTAVSSPITREEATTIAQELYDALYERAGQITKSGHNLFGYEWATIKIDPESIARDRLHYISDGQWISDTEPPVYDIVGLFTQGYTADRYAYGLWESNGEYVRSHSLNGQPGLAPNPFVDEVIDAFQIKYFGIIKDIKYPSQWHS